MAVSRLYLAGRRRSGPKPRRRRASRRSRRSPWRRGSGQPCASACPWPPPGRWRSSRRAPCARARCKSTTRPAPPAVDASAGVVVRRGGRADAGPCVRNQGPARSGARVWARWEGVREVRDVSCSESLAPSATAPHSAARASRACSQACGDTKRWGREQRTKHCMVEPRATYAVAAAQLLPRDGRPTQARVFLI